MVPEIPGLGSSRWTLVNAKSSILNLFSVRFLIWNFTVLVPILFCTVFFVNCKYHKINQRPLQVKVALSWESCCEVTASLPARSHAQEQPLLATPCTCASYSCWILGWGPFCLVVHEGRMLLIAFPGTPGWILFLLGGHGKYGPIFSCFLHKMLIGGINREGLPWQHLTVPAAAPGSWAGLWTGTSFYRGCKAHKQPARLLCQPHLPGSANRQKAALPNIRRLRSERPSSPTTAGKKVWHLSAATNPLSS